MAVDQPMRKPLPDLDRFGEMGRRAQTRATFLGKVLFDRYAEAIASLGLRPNRVMAVAFIEENPGCGQQALAQYLEINRSSTMEMVDRLERDGLVRRGPGPDRRSNSLYLTDAGRASLEEEAIISQQLHEQVFGWMDDAKLEEFMATADEIAKRADAFRPELKPKKPARPRQARNAAKAGR